MPISVCNGNCDEMVFRIVLANTPVLKIRKGDRVMRYALCVISATIMMCSVGWADSVLFVNGDQLTGKIEQLVDGKLVFNSALAGKVTIDMANVKALASDSAVELHLQDGSVLKQQIIGGGDGKLALAAGQATPNMELLVADLSAINPPAKPKPKEPKWEGNISAGITSTHGNTSTETMNGSVALSKRTEKDRTQLSGNFGRSKQADPDTGKDKTTEDWWKTKAKYDYFFSKKFYGYLDGRYEADKIAELDRRVIVGAGGGYQWIESKDTNFSTEAGLASLYEKYGNQTDSSSEMSLQLGYHFDKKLAGYLDFIHDLTYYPSMGGFGDYFLTSNAELRATFENNMFTNFKVLFDYDATPARSKGSTDVKYIWGIGWSF